MTADPTPTPPSAPTEPNSEVRNWGMFCHLAAFAGYLIPLGNVIGPLVVWLMKRDEMPFVADQGKEALNFQITVLIAVVICLPLICVGVGVFLLPLVGLANVIFIILAAIQSSKGVAYRYPVAIRLVT